MVGWQHLRFEVNGGIFRLALEQATQVREQFEGQSEPSVASPIALKAVMHLLDAGRLRSCTCASHPMVDFSSWTAMSNDGRVFAFNSKAIGEIRAAFRQASQVRRRGR